MLRIRLWQGEAMSNAPPEWRIHAQEMCSLLVCSLGVQQIAELDWQLGVYMLRLLIWRVIKRRPCNGSQVPRWPILLTNTPHPTAESLSQRQSLSFHYRTHSKPFLLLLPKAEKYRNKQFADYIKLKWQRKGKCAFIVLQVLSSNSSI